MFKKMCWMAIVLILIALLWPSGSFALRGNSAIPNFTVSDASWSWWCEPKAMRYCDTKDQIYMSWLSSGSSVEGYSDQWIGAYNIDTKVLEKFNLGHKYYTDDHIAPAILAPRLGSPFMVFYTGHNFSDHLIRYRTATGPESVQMGAEKTVSFSNGLTTGVTYCQVYRTGSRILLITRLNSLQGLWAFRVSEDNGATWGPQRTLYDGGYGSYAYVTTQRAKINDFVINFVTGYIPKDPTINMPGNTGTIQAGRINLQTGDITEMQGGIVGNIYTGAGLPIQPNDLTRVYTPQSPEERTRLFGVASDNIDHMEITFMTFSDWEGKTDGMYQYAVWDEGQFKVHSLIGTGYPVDETSYFAGSDIGNFGIVCLAREYKRIWVVELWKTTDMGNTWQNQILDDTYLETTMQVLFRPMHIENYTSTMPTMPENSFLWMHGEFATMHDFNTDIVYQIGSGYYQPYPPGDPGPITWGN